MAKQANAPDEKLLAIYEALVAKVPGLQIKGAKSNYTSMNGNMFSFLTPDNELAFRLSKEQRDAFLAKHPKAICIQYNTVMKDYVLVPDAIVRNRRQLNALWGKCVDNAKELKAKPTTRKAAAKKTTGKKKAAKKKPVKKKTGSKKSAARKIVKKKVASTSPAKKAARKNK